MKLKYISSEIHFLIASSIIFAIELVQIKCYLLKVFAIFCMTLQCIAAVIQEQRN